MQVDRKNGGSFVLDLKSAAALNPEEVGKKAYELNRLHKRGYRILDGSILTTGFFRCLCDIPECEDGRPPKEIEWGDAAREEIGKLFLHLRSFSGYLVVRSSGAKEDGKAKTYAGIFHSETNVKTLEELCRAIKGVWLSAFSERAGFYERESQKDAMAVIIQCKLICDASGAAFSRHPVTHRDSVYIEAVRGNNDALINNEQAANPHALSPPKRRQLERMVKRIERDFAYPCDVEWGIRKGKLYFFQVRPQRLHDVGGVFSVPDDKAVDCILLDRYADPACVCYLSLLDSWQNRVWLSYYSRRKGKRFQEKPLCFLYNRVYWNVAYQRDHFELDDTLPVLRRLQFHLLVLLGAKSWYGRLSRYDRLVTKYHRTADSVQAEGQLLALLDKAIHIFCDVIGKDHFRFLGIAQNLYNRLIKTAQDKQQDTGVLFEHIGAESGKSKTLQVNRDLEAIADQIRMDGEAFSMFLESEEADIWSAIHAQKRYRKIAGQLDRFVDNHGHRGIGCDDLLYPRWRENPQSILVLVKQLLRREREAPKEEAPAKIADRELRGLSRHTCVYMRLREDQRYYFDKSWTLLRLILLSISDKWVTRGAIAHRDDIFHMTMREIRWTIEFADYQLPDDVLRVRKEKFEDMKQFRPPYFFKDGLNVAVQKEGRRNSYKATGLSAGSAEGRIRIIGSLQEIGGVEQGEIGVVKTFHPSWTPILARVSGLIMSYGNMLSHGAVVAREYGIPVVVFNDDATQTFVNGDLVRIDGGKGRIWRIA